MRKTISPLDILKNKSPRNPVRMQERMEAAIASQQIKNVEADTVNELAPSLGDTYLTETGSRADGVIFMENIFQVQMGDNTSYLRTIEIPFTGSFLQGDNAVEVVLTGNIYQETGVAQTIEAELRLKNGDGTIDHMINNTTGVSVVSSGTVKGFSVTFTFYRSARGGNWITCDECWDIEGSTPNIRATEIELSTAESVDDITRITFACTLTGSIKIQFAMDTIVARAFEGLTSSEVRSMWFRTGIDTDIRQEAATTNYGTETTFAVGESTAGTSYRRRALIKPDGLSNLPTGAVIMKAVLYLTINTDLATSGATYNVYRLLKNWTEAGATYNKYDGVTDWTTAGMVGNLLDTADYHGSGIFDRLSSITVGASETVGSVKAFDFTADGLAALNGFIDGTYTYYGFCIISDTELNDCYAFVSYQGTKEGQRPVLYVEYQI